MFTAYKFQINKLGRTRRNTQRESRRRHSIPSIRIVANHFGFEFADCSVEHDFGNDQRSIRFINDRDKKLTYISNLGIVQDRKLKNSSIFKKPGNCKKKRQA